MSIKINKVQSRYMVFFLEYAGELCIISLIEEELQPMYITSHTHNASL
jgi:hypothetical protein